MTTAASLAQSVAPGVSLGFKNRIINGGITIYQRALGTFTPTTAGSAANYSIDRWTFQVNQASKLTVAQSSAAPAGFTNSLLVTSSSAYTPSGTDYFALTQRIEGYNVADLGLGTANAKTFTVSFWVYSSLTGTFGGTIANGAGTRSYPFTYTISSASTWEYKTITISGDTTGTWLTTNGIGLELSFSMGMGSTYGSGTAGAWTGSWSFPSGCVSVVATNAATFYITGVQLEVGTAATNFEFRDYGRELIMCQRYYQTIQNFYSFGINANNATFGANFPIQMRSAPSGSLYSGTLTLSDNTADFSSTASLSASGVTIGGGRWNQAGYSGLSAGKFYLGYSSTTNWIALNSEL